MVRKRKIEKYTVDEFIDALFALKMGKILRVKFLESEKYNNQLGEFSFHPEASCDVRKVKVEKDGKKHFVFSFPVDDPNGEDREIIGEVHCCFADDISSEDIKKLLSSFEIDSFEKCDDDTDVFINTVRRFAMIEPNHSLDVKFYEDYYDNPYNFDYDLYLKSSWK